MNLAYAGGVPGFHGLFEVVAKVQVMGALKIILQCHQRIHHPFVGNWYGIIG